MTCGSGRRARSPATPGSRRSPTGSTPRSSSEVRTASCAAVPGRPSPRPSRTRSGTGTTRAPADLRRAPVRQGRGMTARTTDSSGELRIDVFLRDGALATLADDVRAGLSATQKTLPPKYLYDSRGSELFELITELPEYYPTRAEQTILDDVGADIVELVAAGGAGRARAGLGAEDERASRPDVRQRASAPLCPGGRLRVGGRGHCAAARERVRGPCDPRHRRRLRTRPRSHPAQRRAGA